MNGNRVGIVILNDCSENDSENHSEKTRMTYLTFIKR